MRKRNWCYTAFVAALIGFGCGSEVEPFGSGSVELVWDVAPLGCEAAQVETIEISLENERYLRTARADCGEQVLSMEELAPGSYDLTMEGVQADGATTFVSTMDSIFVRPDERHQFGPIDLVAAPVEARVRWRFDDWDVCDADAMQEVEVTAFDAGYHEVHRSTWDCTSGMATVEGLRAGELLFRVRATGSRSVYEGVSEVSANRGQRLEVDVEMARVDAR